MDTGRRVRETAWAMLGPGALRHRLARTLNAAYAEGLLSERTLAHRLDELFASAVIDPARLVGDLSWRAPRRSPGRRLREAIRARRRRRRAEVGGAEHAILLGLDWNGTPDQLVIGRHPDCDVVVTEPTVSRRHARLTFRDGGWVVQDLDSTNGTRLNGAPVGRCRLRPGDQLELGDQLLRID